MGERGAAKSVRTIFQLKSKLVDMGMCMSPLLIDLALKYIPQKVLPDLKVKVKETKARH